jgi:hypothetical protein
MVGRRQSPPLEWRGIRHSKWTGIGRYKGVLDRKKRLVDVTGIEPVTPSLRNRFESQMKFVVSCCCQFVPTE